MKKMKWLFGGIFLVSLALISIPVMASTIWQQTGGPEGGLISSLAIDPTNSQTVYVGTNPGGVFKSTDGGSSWNVINSGLTVTSGHIPGVTCLAIDPTNSQTVYAGTW